MTLKELKEQRNDLLTKIESIITEAETEVRALSETESVEYANLKSEISVIDNQIKQTEDLRTEGTKVEVEERSMENVMENELRGLDQFVRNVDGEEKRALTVTADGAAVIPENVEGTIVQKMQESSAVFARARKFASVSGTLKIAKETATSTTGFVGEGVNVLEGQIALGEVKLTQKRVGAAISLSNMFINDSAVNVVDYAIDLLSRRTSKAIEKSILTGSTVEEFAGIKGDTEIAKLEVELSDAITIDHFMDLYNAINPEFLDGSGYIMSRTMFNKVAKLKDGNGHFYLQNGIVNGRLTYTLLGAEVVVTDSLDAGTVVGHVPVLFGNIEQAYAVMIKQGFKLQHIVADTTQAMRGSQLLVLDGYMDGAIYNPQAIAKMAIKADV